MNKFLNTRSVFSLILLLIAASALASSVKAAVEGVRDAAFLPVAVFGTVFAYLLGCGSWPPRRSSIFILFFGSVVVLLEASRIREVLWQSLFQLPSLEFNALLSWIQRQPFHTLVPQQQLDEIFNRAEIFMQGLLHADPAEPNIIRRELLWDVPILFLSTWAGWWTGRRSMILTALGPSLAMQAFILNYTDKRTLSLQVAAFAFIFLMGIHHRWSVPKEQNENENRVKRETYGTIFILAFVLAIAAGWAPVFSVRDAVQKIADRQSVNDALGLEKKVIESYVASTSGLPRDHLINTPPQDLLKVAFLANTGERPFLDEEDTQPVVPHYYWRALTYDLYNGEYWSTSPITSSSYVADQTLFEFSGTGYRVIHQTIKKASPEDEQLYWIGALVRASQPFQSTWRVPPTVSDPLLHMDMLGSIIQAQGYSADSLVMQPNETDLRAASTSYPREIREKYLALPADISPRVLDLATQLTAGSRNAYDKARAIEAYLRTYPYTLDVPALPADTEIADYFLFELKTGYCDYYATSMAVLARAAGLPTRLVIGYSSAEYNRATAEYVIRQINAHSWVEVYFPNIGWVEFEPTAGLPRIERPLTSADSEVSITMTPTQKSRDGIVYQKQGRHVEKNPFLEVLLLIVLVLFACAWYLRTQGLLFSHASIASMYEYIYYHGRKLYSDAPPNETPTLFAEKLKTKLMINRRFILPAAGELDRLTALYLKETYSPHPVTADEQEQAVRIWRRLLWRLLYARMILN